MEIFTKHKTSMASVRAGFEKAFTVFAGKHYKLVPVPKNSGGGDEVQEGKARYEAEQFKVFASDVSPPVNDMCDTIDAYPLNKA